MKSDDKIKKIVEWLNEAGLKKEAEELVRILNASKPKGNPGFNEIKNDKAMDLPASKK